MDVFANISICSTWVQAQCAQVTSPLALDLYLRREPEKLASSLPRVASGALKRKDLRTVDPSDRTPT